MGGAAQAKPTPHTRPANPAPHVQAAVAASAQPKAAPGARPAPAAHVQAAVAQAKPRAPIPSAVQAHPSNRGIVTPPPVRWRPGAQPVPAVPAHPASLQPKAASSFPGVVQPAGKRKLSEISDPPTRELRPRKKRRIDYSDKKYDQLIERLGEKDTRYFEKRDQENREKYAKNLSLQPPTEGSQEIIYVKGSNRRQRERVNSLPISKELMSKCYGEMKLKELEPTFFHINAPSQEGNLSQHFVIRQANDYVLFPLVPLGEDRYKQEGKDGPAFINLAINADEAAQWLLETKKKTYRTLRKARIRVARDVNRMAGGLQPRVTYPLRYLAGAVGLTTFAAIIRADKGRVSKATKYIESILKSGSTDFSTRFGGKKPLYLGTGEGSGRGPEGLRKKAKEDPGEDSEYSSDDE
jgi:hypothetical protein